MEGMIGDDRMKKLFEKLPREEMPARLHADIMKRVMAEKPRRALSSDTRGLIIAASVSLVLIAGIFWLFGYLGISLSLGNTEYHISEFFERLDFSHYIPTVGIAASVLILLVVQTLISRHINRKRLEKI